MWILRFLARRPLVALGVLAGLWWLWPGGSRAPAPARPQAAVLADGFAATAGGGRIALFDDEAARHREISVSGAPAGGRVVGVGGRVGLVWRDGRKIAIGIVGDDGEIERTQQFGKRAAQMCDGVATNEHRFGVAWVEADGGIWFVHGPTSPRGRAAEDGDADAPVARLLADPAKADFCAIASAHDKLALLYTEGSRTNLLLCGRDCEGPRRVELPRKSAVLGLGCTRAGCAIATRGEGGAVQATWIARSGKALWTRPLPHAERGTPVSLAGTGAQVAIAYATANEPVVVTASEGGTIATVWQGASDAVPGLAHAAGRLLVARSEGGALTGSLVRVP